MGVSDEPALFVVGLGESVVELAMSETEVECLASLWRACHEYYMSGEIAREGYTGSFSQVCEAQDYLAASALALAEMARSPEAATGTPWARLFRFRRAV